ncbi:MULTISPECIES: hypothetical protein [unclassified Microbacterium]|uniref:hypothetical protein n=1 Tax=unclassified Microbacterium TaxID=2609290 RepID=UPI00386FC46E
MTPTRQLEQAIGRLRLWTYPKYVTDQREWLYDRDLTTVLEAAEHHLKEKTP